MKNENALSESVCQCAACECGGLPADLSKRAAAATRSAAKTGTIPDHRAAAVAHRQAGSTRSAVWHEKRLELLSPTKIGANTVVQVVFCEGVEHPNDLDVFADWLGSVGASVISKEMLSGDDGYHAAGRVIVEVADKGMFLARLESAKLTGELDVPVEIG